MFSNKRVILHFNNYEYVTLVYRIIQTTSGMTVIMHAFITEKTETFYNRKLKHLYKIRNR